MGKRTARVRLSRSRSVVTAGVVASAILATQAVASIAGAVLADRATAAAAQDTYAYVAQLMSARVESVTDAAVDVVSSTASAMERAGRIPDAEVLVAELADRLTLETSVGSIFVGYPDGSALSLTTTDDGFERTDVRPAAMPGHATVTRTTYTAALVPVDVESLDLLYSLEDRPWYAAAASANATLWTDPYISLRTGYVVVSPVTAVHLDGALAAVVGADLDTAHLGALLDDIPIGDHARAFILDTDGRVIAAPSGSVAQVSEIVEATSAVPHAQAIGLPAPSIHLGAADTAPFTVSDDVVTLEQRLETEDGASWVLYLEANAADLAPGLDRFRGAAVAIASVSVAAVVAAGVFAQRLWRPVRVLRHRATTDALTGLANRYEFQRRSRQLVRVAQEREETVLFVILDLDHFKELNDTYGHEAGNDALRAVGAGLRAAVRSHDVAARLGGDEFVAVVRLPTGVSPVEVTRRVRRSAERAARGSHAGASELSVTAGFATSADEGYDLDRLQAGADAGLVAGKRRRKGQIYSIVGSRLASLDRW